MFGTRPHRLDGNRLLDVAQDRLWLVFGGRRHHVTSGDVHTSIFRKAVGIQRVNGQTVAQLDEGEELLFGTSLVRNDRNVMINLLAVHPSRTVLYPIPSTEIFDKYGFGYELCRTVPEQTTRKIKVGRPLS